MIRSWLIVIGACLAVAGALGYYKYSQIQAAMAFAATFPEPVVAVEAVLATEESWQPVTSVTAEVVATRTVDLSNELAGAIVAVGFESGAEVEAGQVLVRLDTSEESAQLAAARADAEIARLELERNQKLIASGAAAQEARDRAKAGHDAAVAAVNRLLAVIEKKTLRAPFDATTGLHQLDVGQYLDKGSVVTRLIGVSDSVWIDFTLPQQQSDPAI
jgi:RND family efflux transporter MFP subunit